MLVTKLPMLEHPVYKPNLENLTSLRVYNAELFYFQVLVVLYPIYGFTFKLDSKVFFFVVTLIIVSPLPIWAFRNIYKTWKTGVKQKINYILNAFSFI